MEEAAILISEEWTTVGGEALRNRPTRQLTTDGMRGIIYQLAFELAMTVMLAQMSQQNIGNRTKGT